VAAIQQNGGRPLARADLARLQSATPVAPVRMITGGGAVVRAGAPAPGSARPGNFTPPRPGTSAPAASAGAQAPNFADRERVLQNSRLTPAPRDSNRPPAATPPTQALAPSQAAAPQLRTDRPPSAQPHLPATQQQAYSSDDPTHAYSRPSSAAVNRPPPAAAPPANASPRPQEPQYQERYRPPVAAPPPVPANPNPRPPEPQYQERYRPPAAAPPPAPVREAPAPPPVSRPQERSAPSQPPVSRPQERSAPPPARAPEPKAEPRDAGPHADRTDRTSRERGER
jgi:hypothetical protein